VSLSGRKLFSGLRKYRVQSTDKRRLSIRSHLILLVLATLLPVLIFAGIMFWQHVELQRAAVDRGMRDTARALSLAVDREIGQVLAILETLAASPYLDSKNLKAFYDLSSRAATARTGSWIVIFDRSGQQITNTLRPFGEPLPNTRREANQNLAENIDYSFRGTPETVQKVIASGQAVITDLFVGIVSKHPSVAIHFPVVRAGKVVYVLSMGILSEKLTALLVEQGLPSDWYAVIVDRKGVIISRQPNPEESVGRPLQPMLTVLLPDVDEGSGGGRTWDGVEAYRAFSRSKFTGWSVGVGVPRAVIDGPLNRYILILGAGAAALVLLGFGIALILGKRISAPLVSLARSAEAIQHGKTAQIEPSNVREVAELHSEFIRSVAERQQLEQELRQAQKLEAIGTLAGGIAHDFNNTLNIIRAYAMLIGRQSADKRITESTKVIDEEVQRGAAVVRQLMTIARKTETSLVRTDINQLVLTVSDLIKQTFPRTIEVKLKLNRTLTPVLADANQITQALLNICLNARDAMTHGGNLTLATELIDSITVQERHPEASARPHFCIAISDTGLGMDETVRSRALEPFFTTKSVGEGTGLGLAMVYGIVKNHDGMLDIESEPGVGTTVRIYLPALSHEKSYSASGVSSDVIRSVRNPAEQLTILVVEDEAAMVDLLTNSLSQEGYRVLDATDGVEAINIYQRHRSEIDLVLIDLGLPKVSGLEVIRSIKKLNEDARILVTTGYLEPELKTELVAAGVKDYIQKPYTIPDVVQRISHHLSAAALASEPTIH
jgi:signal transduction histidine kinase/CheY-like chemotaxis protein